MPDELFRQLAIKTSTAKLTPEVLLEIMEVFYGADAVRASVSTELTEPFTLADGDTLGLLMDERDVVTVRFRESDFGQITQAKADEVAAVITRDLRRHRNTGFAVSVKDPITGLNKVRIYSGSLGLSSSVRVTGGRGQLGLQFPTRLTTYNAAVSSLDGYNWVVSSPAAGTNRVTLNNPSGTSKVDLSSVHIGDYVVFEAANSTVPKGVYQVLDMGVSFSGSTLVQFFDIAASAPNHTFLQLSNQELTFFRPTRSTIHQAQRTVIVAQTQPQGLDIVIPATTQTVGRTVKTGAYLHDRQPLNVSNIRRIGNTVKVTTNGAHGLKAGDQILVEEAFGGTAAPALTVGNPGTTGNPGTSDASLATIWTQTRRPDGQGRHQHNAITLADGRVLLSGGYFKAGSTDTAMSSCALFRISNTSTLADGSKQYTYHWDSAASLSAPRNRHAASLLDDGRVLVTGGFNGSVYLDSSEIYTPNSGSGSWAAGPIMVNKRMNHQQVTLNDGRVLVCGGAKNETVALRECELYDPVANTFSSTGNMLEVRADHQAVKLSDGRVLVCGGRPLALPHPDDSFTLAHWKIDEASGTTVADTTGIYPLTAVNTPTIIDGKIDRARDFGVANSHLTGAGDSAAGAALAGEWTISAWFKGGSGVILSYGAGTTPMVQVENLTGNLIKWTWGSSNGTTTPLSGWTGFWNHVAVVARSNGTNSSIEVYLNGSLKQTFTGITAPAGVTGTWYIGRSVSGPSTHGGYIDDVCVSKKARSAAEIFQVYRLGQGAVGTNEGLLPAANGVLHSSCEIFNPSTGTWSRTGSMTFARMGHRAVALPDGRVLVFGGTGYRDGTGDAEALIADAEIWDPATGCWYPVGRLGTPRSNPGGLYIASKKKVLVAGGATRAEYFDVPTATWRYAPAGPTSVSGYERLAAVDGEKAILVGGQVSSVDSTPTQAWLFQPGEDVYALGGLNGSFTVAEVIDAQNFTYQTPDRPGLTTNQNSSVTIKPMGAVAAGKDVGPFLLDQFDGVAVTGIEAEITMDLHEGQQYGTLEVSDASSFPDEEGWLVIGFGTGNSVHPVRYLGKLSNTSLILDYSFKFPKSNLVTGFSVSSATRASGITTLTLALPAGSSDHGVVVGQKVYFKSTSSSFSYGYKTVTARTATTISFVDPGPDITTADPGSIVVKAPKVTLLKQKGLYVPKNPEQIGAAYITASSAGRKAAIQAVKDSVAAGLQTDIQILYPSDRGLAGEGLPVAGQSRLSDKVVVWGGDNLQKELAEARGEE
jgi:hypothetical protein